MFKWYIVFMGDLFLVSFLMFDNSFLIWVDCFQECYYVLGCQFVVIEGENCRLYIDIGNYGNDFFNVVSSLFYLNFNGKIESCLV